MADLYGRVRRTMERKASGKGRRAGTLRFDQLTDVCRCLQTGSSPSRSAAETAHAVFSGVSALSVEDGEGAPAGSCRGSGTELTCIGVSLLVKITSSVKAPSLRPEVVSYFVEVLTVLFRDMDLMSQLAHHLQAEDQIISHLAAKSVSACVFYHLQQSGAVSPIWEQTCLQAFHSSGPSTGVYACLWSLTDVFKRLLKGAHHEVFGKLLTAFDFSLSALCSRLLPGEGNEAMRRLVDFGSSSRRHWGTTLCLLMDLLEVLTASSWICGESVCLRSQRLTHIHSSALLTLISCSSECFVKKRALLLLKRAVLQKAGEDWALGDVLFPGLKHEHFNAEMNVLTESVLTAVAANWLDGIQVDSCSFFGGTRHTRRGNAQKPNCVMIRAVSLLLLKSMELHIHTVGGTAGVDSATEMYGCLQSLWGFLKRHSIQLMEATHLCCWVSLLFGEQDDDMMEAAKALLSIFLHHRQCSGLEGVAVLEAACASGYNPHCHFLLLLQSISFDHSILLDFLISTETCFLEYFVRYLKFLRADWQGFSAACGLATLCVGYMSAVTGQGEQQAVELCAQPTCDVSPVAAGLRLVEYDSSGESDPENMDSPDEPGTSVCADRFDALHVRQKDRGPPVPTRQTLFESSQSAGLLSQPTATLERRPEGSSSLMLQNEQTSCPNMTALSGRVTGEASARAVSCLSQLKEVVTRLQAKELFPYNPSSLLKLLAQVENFSQQSNLSLSNQ